MALGTPAVLRDPGAGGPGAGTVTAAHPGQNNGPEPTPGGQTDEQTHGHTAAAAHLRGGKKGGEAQDGTPLVPFYPTPPGTRCEGTPPSPNCCLTLPPLPPPQSISTKSGRGRKERKKKKRIIIINSKAQ